MKHRHCLAICCGLAALSVAASVAGEPATLILTDDTEEVILGKYLAVLPDSAGVWSIDDVNSQKVRRRFVDSEAESPHLGQTRRAVWSRFTLQNESEQRHWIFEVRPGIHFGIEVYWRDDSTSEWMIVQVGEHVPFNELEIEHRHFAVRLELELGQKREYMVRATPDVFFVHQRLYSESAFAAHVRRESISLGAYYGLIVGMAIYNLVLFLYLRDNVYLYYVLMVATGALYFLQFNGVAQEFLWPGTAFGWDRYVLVTGSIYLVFVLRFVQVFLLTHAHAPGVHRVMSWFIGVSFAFPVASLAGLHEEFFPAYITVYNWSLWLIIIVAAVLTLKRGFVPARYFLVAWSGYVLGPLITLSVVFGMLPFGVYSWNAFQIGHAFEILLLSLALGNRISTLRRAKEAQDRELDTARRLQLELLPDRAPSVEGLDIAGRCHPAGDVGGDMYRYFESPNGIAVGMADVTGHSMEAAIPAVMFTGLLDSQMQTNPQLPRLFANLNDSLFRALEKRRFVCFVMIRITDSNRLQLITCGCPFPLLVRADGNITELGNELYPLGVKASVTYDLVEISIEPGNCLVLYSDGISEALNKSGEFFGEKRTWGTISEGHLAGISAGDICDRLLHSVREFAGGVDQADDMTCVVVRVRNP